MAQGLGALVILIQESMWAENSVRNSADLKTYLSLAASHPPLRPSHSDLETR